MWNLPEGFKFHSTTYQSSIIDYSILLMACSKVAVWFQTLKTQFQRFTDTETPQISLPTSNCSPIVVNNYVSSMNTRINKKFPHVWSQFLLIYRNSNTPTFTISFMFPCRFNLVLRFNPRLINYFKKIVMSSFSRSDFWKGQIDPPEILHCPTQAKIF